MTGTGGQDKPEWGVNMNRNLHIILVKENMTAGVPGKLFLNRNMLFLLPPHKDFENSRMCLSLKKNIMICIRLVRFILTYCL